MGDYTRILGILVGLALFTTFAVVRGNRHYEGHETAKDRVLRLIATIGPLNFVAFIVGYLVLGGDALGGHVVAGHYYLSNHGSDREVSQAVFVYSACHGYSAFLGMFAAVAAGWVWNRPSR